MRYRFGTSADYIVSLGTDNAATLEPGVTVTCWNMPSGGTQHTDLTDTDGTTPLTSLVTTATGAVPEFYGPDGVTALYLDAGSGRRRTLSADVGEGINGVVTDLATHEAAANPHGTGYADLTGVYAPSIAALLTEDPFYVAHRGSGAQYPEHTMAAYEASLAAGAKAIEVSAHITKDDVLVCFHDTTLDRVTDYTGSVRDYTYAALSNLVKVGVQDLLGDGWEDQPIPKLRDVLDRLYGKCVIFLEAKSNESIAPTMDLLETHYPDAPRSVVWKGYYTNTTFPEMRSRGFTTWGYVDAGTTDTELDAVDPDVDMWGVPFAMTDARIADIVARTKPVICWEVHRRSDVTRLTGLGVQGMMCSEYQYVTTSAALFTVDDWATKVKAPGNAGLVGYSESYALKYGTDPDGDVYIDRASNESVSLGAMSPTPADTYTISFEMKWDTLPSATLHSDFVFGKPDDTKYQFGAADNASGGYHFVFRGNGDMQLYRHDANVASGTSLGSIATTQPVAGQWMTFTIEVGPQFITVTRTDIEPDVSFVADDATYRGGYMQLSQGSVNSVAAVPHWRNLSIV